MIRRYRFSFVKKRLNEGGVNIKSVVLYSTVISKGFRSRDSSFLPIRRANGGEEEVRVKGARPFSVSILQGRDYHSTIACRSVVWVVRVSYFLLDFW